MITQHILSITCLFADNTCLASTTSNIDDLQGIINHALREILKWSKQWLVTSTPDKTEVLYFGNCQPPLLEFNNTILSITFDHENGVGMQGTRNTGLRILCIPDQRQQFVMKLIGPGCTCHPFLPLVSQTVKLPIKQHDTHNHEELCHVVQRSSRHMVSIEWR